MSAEPDTPDEDHPCPTCGKGHPSQQVMRIHHARAHGERLVDLETCNHCGDTFEPESGSEGKYCSLECVGAANSTQLQKECIRCSATFTVPPCDDDQQYCSQDCYLDGLRGRSRIECSGCGMTFQRYPSQGSNQYCSSACYGEAKTTRPRPDSLEMLAWLLYEYEDNTLRETYKRINVVRDDHVPHDEVREILHDLEVLQVSHPDQIRKMVRNGEIDPDTISPGGEEA